jgi:predicted SAM-dependent methyltransferase
MTDERLNFGCGPMAAPGWINSDMVDHGQEHVGDIRDGLPFLADTLTYIASHHSLQMLAWQELVPALTELRRVTMPGGWLRLSVPDLLAAVYAYEVGDSDHFQIADDHEKTLDGKLALYVSQAGSTRSVFTGPWLEELCGRAGWVDAHRVGFCVTSSPWPEITSLDSRPAESIFIEATA